MAKETLKTRFRGVCLFLLFLAPVCFFLGWRYYEAVSDFQLRSVETTAVIQDYVLKNDSSEDDGLSYYARVSFSTPEGEVSAVTNVGYREPPDNKGKPLKVLYDPQNMQDVRDKTFKGLWGAPVILSSAGLLFLMLGLWSLI